MTLRRPSRRWRTCWIGRHDLLEVFLQQVVRRQMRLALIDNLPADCRVESVHYDACRAAFGVALSHPSFEEVADGEMPPECKLEIVIVQLERDGESSIYHLAPALLAEVERWRSLFRDVCLDKPDVQEAYEAGRCDERRETARRLLAAKEKILAYLAHAAQTQTAFIQHFTPRTFLGAFLRMLDADALRADEALMAEMDAALYGPTPPDAAPSP